MTLLRRFGLLSVLALAACAPRVVPPAPAPTPPPVQTPTPRPVQPQPAPQPSTGWLDAALTPGDWTHQGGGASAAVFGAAGTPIFTLRCEAGGRVSLARGGAQGTSITFRTSSEARTLAASQSGAGVTASVTRDDPLLDALAFSRGRFAVETVGAPQLVIPAWPEVARVVEDCRR